jgi:hypothetical protein
MLGRYFSTRDINVINSFNSELYNDIIQNLVTLYKMSADSTAINIYGESSPKTGKQFYPGIDIMCLIDRADIETPNDDFGPTRSQNAIFKFRELDLKNINFFPGTGDLIEFNARYYECDNVVQEQFLAGIPEKSFSIIVHCHYSRLSKVDLVFRNS